MEYSPRRLYRDLPWVHYTELLKDNEERDSAVEYVEKYLALPGQPPPILLESEHEDRWREDWQIGNHSSTYTRIMYNQWLRSRTCVEKHPRIGHALSYDAWKAANPEPFVIPPVSCADIMASTIPNYDFRPLSVSLQHMFRDKRLQVVVKLSSVELTPEEIRYQREPYYLEDPHYRVCSTPNLAPQQKEYWFDDALSVADPQGRVSLPEIYGHIYEYAEGWPMSTAEAIELSQQERSIPDLSELDRWESFML